MKSIRAAVAASAVACIAFGAFTGTAAIASAPTSGTAAHSVLAGGGGTDGDSGWGGRVINDAVTGAAGITLSGDSGWGSSGS
ncbi:hypothetical protein OHS71_02860 [Streptomyces sp. NBC_00377]|uniref:hypothetical protein n=1 Tax=unclassified Streptomyces TaxID=2593676 RepID=UPI002E1DC7DB|nr:MULTISPECIES: hypothetical protein [unclassified Streptomyces]